MRYLEVMFEFERFIAFCTFEFSEDGTFIMTDDGRRWRMFYYIFYKTETKRNNNECARNIWYMR